MLWYLGVTSCTSIAAALIFIYFLKRGQFDDAEEAKYQLFRDEE